MSIQRVATKTGTHYRARVKSHGKELAAKTFTKRADAVAWEQNQARLLRHGEWIDPRRGKVPLRVVADGWLLTRDGVKRRTRETDELIWRRYIAPTLGERPLLSITAAQVSEWAAGLIAAGRSPATARRSLSTLRSILDHAVADERLLRNPASSARSPRGGARREGQALDEGELYELARACRGSLAEVVLMLGFTGMRWGELAGLQVGDRVRVPGDGLRLQRAVLASRGSGELYIDSLKTHKARTIPLAGPTADIFDRRAGTRDSWEWLFTTGAGTPLREGNWQRQVKWNDAKVAIGRPTLRVHDLRHSAASIWLGRGADPKVVQRILGHASATMTMDLYGHLIDSNLWDSADRIGGVSGALSDREQGVSNA